ncbi:hypothetical protein CCACVL1_08237 [Corchorus capsularis]|uniref:Uncharacterized protein n=1 Tax=Corchorus capsularis TaxID=210143 RepID=A0A1R3J1S9_COCAP|nr:hypothetical protein CCACVL1_08237 [Corchorus capsularis]
MSFFFSFSSFFVLPLSTTSIVSTTRPPRLCPALEFLVIVVR